MKDRFNHDLEENPYEYALSLLNDETTPPTAYKIAYDFLLQYEQIEAFIGDNCNPFNIHVDNQAENEILFIQKIKHHDNRNLFQ